jgi:hypothetical protein
MCEVGVFLEWDIRKHDICMVTVVQTITDICNVSEETAGDVSIWL